MVRKRLSFPILHPSQMHITCLVAAIDMRSLSFLLRLHSPHQLEKSLWYFFISLKAELQEQWACTFEQTYNYTQIMLMTKHMDSNINIGNDQSSRISFIVWFEFIIFFCHFIDKKFKFESKSIEDFFMFQR